MNLRFFIIILVLLLKNLDSISQDTKKITKNHSNYYEIFYVLKSDTEYKSGNYKKLNYDNRILEEGNYTAGFKEGIWKVYYPIKKKPLRYIGKYSGGKQDSLWTGYHENGKIYSKGDYITGKRAKIWEFFKDDGSVLQTYDYETGSILINNDSSSFPYKIIGEVRDTNNILSPFYIGGSKDFFYEWNNIDVKLPPIRGELNESILVGMIVSSIGKIEKYTIESG